MIRSTAWLADPTAVRTRNVPLAPTGAGGLRRRAVTGIVAHGSPWLLPVVLLVLPFLAYAALAGWRFGDLAFSGYLPLEELRAAFAGRDPRAWFMAPLASVNVTSTSPIAATYTFALGPGLLAAATGALLGLELRARALSCPLALGGLSTLGATAGAVTGFAGCCGVGSVGAMLALTGLGSLAATTLFHAATLLNAVLLIALIARRWRSVPPSSRS